jgi:hypothetical protein
MGFIKVPEAQVPVKEKLHLRGLPEGLLTRPNLLLND